MGQVSGKFAVLTPPGRGAVATILVHSSDLLNQMDDLFAPASGKNFSECVQKSSVIYGRWKSDGEDLIVAPIEDNTAEIHCHGGDLAVTAIIESLNRNRFEQATNDEIRSFLNLSPWKHSIRQSLTKSTSQRTAKILLHQLAGATDWIDDLISQLDKGQTVQAKQKVDQSIDTWTFGRHLTSAWNVVFCGAPNVGKSSLINAFAGFERAIVHSTPGTTRDVISIYSAIDGWPVIVKDTAGIRDTDDEVEKVGVQLARQQVAEADCVVLVSDATTEAIAPTLVETLAPDVLVFNKTDLGKPSELWTNLNVPKVATSALLGDGVPKLMEAIATSLVPVEPENDTLLIVNEFQRDAFSSVQNLLAADKNEAALDLLNGLLSRKT